MINQSNKIFCVANRIDEIQTTFNLAGYNSSLLIATQSTDILSLTNEIKSEKPDAVIFDLTFDNSVTEDFFISGYFSETLPIVFVTEKEEMPPKGSLLVNHLTDQVSSTQLWRPPLIVGRLIELKKLRSQNQQLLQKDEDNQDLIRALVENAPFGVVSFDMEGKIGLYNKLFVKITGLSPDQNYAGTDVKPLFYKTTDSLLHEVLQGNVKVFSCKATIPEPENKADIQITAAPFRNKNGQIVGGTFVLRDLTAQKLAERQKKEADERFSKTFSASPLAMVIIEADNRKIVEVNQAWSDLTGHSREESVGQSIIDLHRIDDEIFGVIEEIIRQEGRLSEARLNIQTKQGEKLTTLATIIFFETNEKRVALLTLVDITQRLRENEQILILSHAIQQMPLAVLTVELDGSIRYTNPQANLLLGYSVDELMTQKINWLQQTTGSKSHQDIYDQIYQGKIWSGEIQQKRKSGELVWVYLTIVPIKDENENIIRFVLIEENISQKKKIEKTLEQNRLRYKQMFMNNPIPMYVFNTKTLNIREANQKACEEYGYTEEEFLKLNLHQILAEDSVGKDELNFNIENDFQDTGLYNGILSQHRHNDGSVVDVRVNIFSVQADEDDHLRMVIAQNITDQLRTHRLLEEAIAKAEESNRLKTNFLNNISHEIRTPLNGILGVTTLLSDPDLEKDEIPDLLEIIEISTARLTQTITDFMDVSLLSSGLMEVHPKPISVRNLIKKTKSTFELECVHKGLSINVTCPDNHEDISLLLDPELTVKALDHLMRNAIKYTSSGGIELGAELKGNIVRIFVKDTGIGISKENIGKVLQYFQQEDDRYARAYEGNGLGLSIVNGMTQLMGGELSIESEKGKGSVFSMCFPRNNSNS